MHGEAFFYQAFIYLSAAVLAVPIARAMGLGSVLGYLIAGIVIGPFVLGLIGKEGQDIMHFAEFGVVMMLFIVGLELQPSLLWRMRGPLLGMGSTQVIGTGILIAGTAMLAGLNWREALALGMILALSSTAIVLQMLSEKNLMKTDAGQSAFSVLLFQDLAVIPILALLPLLASGPPVSGGGHKTWLDGLPGWAQPLTVLAVLGSIILAGRFLSRHVFRLIARARVREVFTAAALLMVIGIAILMTKVGLSPALGTFVAGVVLADSEYRHELESDIEPFKGLLLGLFFIAVGASIDFRLVMAKPVLIALLVLGLAIVKLVVLFTLGKVFRMGLDQNFVFSFSLAQGGEFAFVLFSFAAQNRVLGPEITGPLTAAVALSMAITPLMMLLNEKLLLPRLGTLEEPQREPDVVDESNPVIIAGFGKFGNVVGRFLRASGVGVTVLEVDSDRVELLRKLGLKVYYGDASRHDLLHAAGAERARLLILAIDDAEKTLEIVETARKHFPNLGILTRARGRFHAYQLIEKGIEFVYRETLDSSLRMGAEALRRLDYPGYFAHRAARKFRKHDEDHLRELAEMHRDEKAHLSAARRRIQDLEKIMTAERENESVNRDTGWDTTSLRKDFGGQDPKRPDAAPEQA